MKDITVSAAKQELICEYLLDTYNEWEKLTERKFDDRDFHMEGLASTSISVIRYIMGIIYGGEVGNSENEVYFTRNFRTYDSLLKREEQE